MPESPAEGSQKSVRRRRRKENTRRRSRARRIEQGLAVGLVGEAALPFTRIGASLLRKHPVSALLAGALGFAGLQTAKNARAAREFQALPEAPAAEDVAFTQSNMASFQEAMRKRRLERMQRVAERDPALFRQLAAMVAGSSRPRTTSRTERIGPQPSVQALLDSGFFDGPAF